MYNDTYMYIASSLFLFEKGTLFSYPFYSSPPPPPTHTHHLLGSLLPIHKSLGDDAWCEDLITLAELLEENTVREPETADSNALQYTIATQLVQNQKGSYLSRLLLVVGNDATDKVRLRGTQSSHEVVQLFL